MDEDDDNDNQTLKFINIAVDVLMFKHVLTHFMYV